MKREGLFFGLCSILTLLFVTTTASAATVTARFQAVSPGLGVRIYADRDMDPTYELSVNTIAGAYTFLALASDYDPIEAGIVYKTFCIDIGQHVYYNGTYTWTVTDINDAPVPPTYSITTISAAQELDLQKLYAQYYGTAVSSTSLEAAAFQAAVWEIVNEHWNGYDVTGGSFKVQSGWSASTLANSYLSSLTAWDFPSQTRPELVALVSQCVQDQMFLVPGGDQPPIPEPVTLLGLSLGLGCLGTWFRRRMS